ncbi:hypothetical protein V6Z11_A05G377000 [Gossypium hirsutum]
MGNDLSAFKSLLGFDSNKAKRRFMAYFPVRRYRASCGVRLVVVEAWKWSCWRVVATRETLGFCLGEVVLALGCLGHGYFGLGF